MLSTKGGRLLAVCAPEDKTGIGKFFDTPDRREVYDYSYDGIMRSFEASFERTGLDRFDILFVHDLGFYLLAFGVAGHLNKAAADPDARLGMRTGVVRRAWARKMHGRWLG